MAANDKILVSTPEMEATITKYEQARNTLNEAFTKLSNAKEHLDRCYKGPAYLALCAKWLTIYANVKTAETAVESAVKGLKTVIGTMEEHDSTVISTMSSLDTGASAPTYL